ncbi:MAG: UPF0179 family protein [Candidatus Thermoplasmatota archaeon]|nr:UPF0179 family protein [Candidatus Thermoplasmatota archaeon]
MSSVTLIGKDLAKEGLEFRFGGCLSKCQDCELKNSCCGLKKNRWYKVKGVRDKSHDCKVHDGKVNVVEVEEIPIETAASGPSVIEGSVIRLEDKECDDIDCENYHLCHPNGIEFNKKYNIEEVGEDIDCPEGEDLKMVKLK